MREGVYGEWMKGCIENGREGVWRMGVGVCRGGVWVYGERESGYMESGRGGVWRVDEGVYAEWA